jgi:hypothetical protein
MTALRKAPRGSSGLRAINSSTLNRNHHPSLSDQLIAVIPRLNNAMLNSRGVFLSFFFVADIEYVGAAPSYFGPGGEVYLA